eukprot:3755327-Amphidinium_carterae.1
MEGLLCTKGFCLYKGGWSYKGLASTSRALFVKAFGVQRAVSLGRDLEGVVDGGISSRLLPTHRVIGVNCVGLRPVSPAL